MIKIAHHPIYAHPLPEGHRFPMLKYELIPQQLLHEGTITAENLFAPDPCDRDIILLTHDADYLERVTDQRLTAMEQRKIGFPQSPALAQRELIITQGTIDCCKYALQFGAAMNTAGGTHHAFAGSGEGFCLLNDVAVASNYLLHARRVKKILVIDLDVHQGNGTAKLFEGNDQVFTFSMHGEKNFPLKKEQSDLDIPLPDGIQDAAYLAILEENLIRLLQEVQPDFAFYVSGVDILETDRLGKLKVSLEGCRQRDAFVFEQLKQRSIPVTVVMGGGYSPDIRTILEAHCNTFRTAVEVYGGDR